MLVARISRTMLNKSGKSKYPCLLLGLRGRNSVFNINCDVSCRFHRCPVSLWGSVLLILVFWEFLSLVDVEFLSSFFFLHIYWNDHTGFLLYSVNMVNYIYWLFFLLVPSFSSLIMYSWINSGWSCFIILFKY